MGLFKELLNKKIVAEVETGLCDNKIFFLKLDTGERFTLELKSTIVYDDSNLEIELRPFSYDDISHHDSDYLEDLVDSGFSSQSEVDEFVKKKEAEYEQNELNRIKRQQENERAEYLKLKAKFEGK